MQGVVSHSPAATTPRRDPVPMAAWLMLLLSEGESYGRALFRRLSERGLGIDPAFSYRTLRVLECEGAITSRWTESHHGPRRRSYDLTDKGRRMLAEHAACIKAKWQLYDRFVRAHADACQHGGDALALGNFGQANDAKHAGHEPQQPTEVGDAPSPDVQPSTVSRELLAAWLLLLLRDGESYGYGLQRAFEQRHVHPDSGALYRVLQTLEGDGLLQSRWERSATGPRRRSYQLTAQGLRRLDTMANSINASREKYAAFLRAYEPTTM